MLELAARHELVFYDQRGGGRSRTDDPTPVICQGTWEGRIAFKPEGENGFGYDPLFYVPELNCTSAQLDKEQKNNISHRGKAMAELLKQLS